MLQRTGRTALGFVALLIMIIGLSVPPASAVETGDETPSSPNPAERAAPGVALAVAVGEGSCIGDEACFQNSGEVGADSCNGLESCYQNSGDVGADSCNGLESCSQQAMEIGDGSCNGETACRQQMAMDPDIDGFGICPFDFPCGSVGDNSCNGLDACFQNHGNVGNGSCNGEDICRNQSQTVGDCEFNSVMVDECVGATEPVVAITTPSDDVDVSDSLLAGFSCKDTGGYRLASCIATLNGEAIDQGAAIDTTKPGLKTLVVVGTDSSGNTSTESLEIFVAVPASQRVLTGEFAAATGRQASVARLYMAVFLRQPDAAGNAYWVERADEGTTMWDIAGYFVASEEFILTYDDLDNAAFIDLLYINVMGRLGDEAGAAYWTKLLDDGVLDRGGVTLQFSESPEFLNVTQTT